MTRHDPRKSVDAQHGEGRRRAAQDYLAAARDALALSKPGRNCSPAVSQLALAAVAYADALTVRRAGIVNQHDHAQAPRLLRDTLKDALPEAQERRFKKILGVKDEAQYGARAIRYEEALRLVEDVEAFAQWAEDILG